MAADPFDALRLTLMQDVLPVGLAVAERARRGGPREVLAAFDGSSADPLGRLREEGEPSASQLRDSLDRLQPGLGNPVLRVEVQDGGTVRPPVEIEPDATDPAELQATLARIAARLDRLERQLAAADSATPR
jgi:hypothetical protein